MRKHLASPLTYWLNYSFYRTLDWDLYLVIRSFLALNRYIQTYFSRQFTTKKDV
jgi:hypothetical protein